VHVTARASAPRLGAAALVLALGILGAGTARAQSITKQECIDAFTDAQHHRESGKLAQARKELRLCASDACPALLHNDCLTWLADVEHLVPSVVFAARDVDGHDLLDASVSIDGEVLASPLDGRPVDVDPGEHVVRFTAPDRQPHEERVLLREGEKVRSLTVTMKPIEGRAPEGTEDGAAAKRDSRPIPATAWIFGGIGATAFATAGAMALIGLPRWNECHKGGCSASDQRFSDSLNTVGNVALVVGAVSAVATLYFFLTRPHVASF
jgi:hypothetical protein